MAGDINGFIYPAEDSDDINEKYLEISVMIAEKKFRERGLAREAVSLIILYVNIKLSVTNFIAKINSDNSTSISLFKKLYFIKQKFNKLFNCFTFKFDFENYFKELSKNKVLRCEAY